MHCRDQFKTYKHYPNIKLIKEHIQKENKKAARRLLKLRLLALDKLRK